MADNTAAAVLYTRAEMDARKFWAEAERVSKKIDQMAKKVVKVPVELNKTNVTAMGRQMTSMFGGWQKQAKKFLSFKTAIDTSKSKKDIGDLERSVVRSGVKMRAALGQIRLKIPQADSDAVRRQVDGLGSSFGSLKTLILGVFGGNLLAGAFQSLTGMIKEAAFGFNSLVEQSKIGFTQMLGTGKLADDLLDKLKQFANVTPFELKDLIPLSRQMLATGTALKDLIPNMRTIGDAVSAMGGSREVLEGVQRALGQIATKGRVQGEELLQLSERGIQAYRYLQQGLGVSALQLQKMMQKGQVTAQAGIKAILAGMQRDFGGMMEAQAKTFQGAMSTIKDSVTRFAADAFKPIYDEISAFAYQFGQVVSADQFQKWGAKIGQSVATGVSIARKAVQTLSDFIQANKGITIAAIAAVTLAYTGLATVIQRNPLVATIAFIKACEAMRDRTDWIGAAARTATPLLYALAAALTAVQVAALMKGLPELGAKMLGFTAAAEGGATAAAAAAAKFASLGTSLKSVGTFFTLVKTYGTSWAGLTAVIEASTVGISAFAAAAAATVTVLLTLVGGLAAIGWEKYNEKAATAAAMNRDVEVSAARMGKAVATTFSAAQWGKSASAIKAATDLKAAFEGAKKSAEGLKKFQAELAKTKSVVNFGAKFDTPEAKELMNLEIKQLQRQADDHAIKIQLKAEADKAALDAASITTFGFVGEAFYQTWGRVTDWFKGIWTGMMGFLADGWNVGMENLKASWATLADAITGGFGAIDAATGGWISRLSQGLSDIWRDTVAGAGVVGNWFKTQFGYGAANYGETNENGPSLPAGVAPRPAQTAAARAQQTAEQKRIKVLEGQLKTWQDKEKAGPPVVANSTVDNKKLKASLDATQKAYESFASTIEGLKGQMDSFGKQTVVTATKTKLIADGFDRISPSGYKVALSMAKIVDQMKAMDEVRGGIAGLLQGMEDQMFGLGSAADPFYKAVQSTKDLVNNSLRFKDLWKQGTNLAIKGLGQAGTQLDRIEAKIDALNPTGGGAGGVGGGGTLPAWAASMNEKVGSSIGLQCGETITKFLRQSGFQTSASALARSGNARPNADGSYAPGTVFHFRGGSQGYRNNHYAAVAADGQHWLESNWVGKNQISNSRAINWRRDVAAATWGGRVQAGYAGGAQRAVAGGAAAVSGAGMEAQQVRQMADRARSMRVPVEFQQDFLKNNQTKWKNAPRANGDNENYLNAYKYLASNDFTKAAKAAGLTAKEVAKLGSSLLYAGKQADAGKLKDKIRVLSDETKTFMAVKQREFNTLEQSNRMYQHGVLTAEQLEKATQRASIQAEVFNDAQLKNVSTVTKNKMVNDRLWATMRVLESGWKNSALGAYNTEIQQLKDSYEALNDATVGAIAKRSLEADATYRHLPLLQKESLLRARIRNEIAASIQGMAKETQERARGMQAARESEKARNPLDSLAQQFGQQDAAAKRNGTMTSLLPPGWWKEPQRFTTLFKDVPKMMQLAKDRAWEFSETMKDWDVSSFKDTNQAVLDLMNQQLLTTEQISALQNGIKSNIAGGRTTAAGNITPGQLQGLQSKAAMDSFGATFNLGDIQKRAEDVSAALNARNFEKAMQKGLVDPVRQAQIEMDNAMASMDEWIQKQEEAGVSMGQIIPEIERYTAAWNEYVDAARRTATADHQDAFEAQMKPLRDAAIAMNSPLTQQEQRYGEMKKSLREQRFTDAEIDEIMNLQRWLDDTEKFRGALYNFRDSMTGIFEDAFSKIYDEGFKNFFSNIVDGVGKMLNQIAAQIITSYAMKGLMGLLGVKTGADGGLSGGGGFFGGLFGAIFGGGKNPGSVAPGGGGSSLPPGYTPSYPPMDNAGASLMSSRSFGAGVGGSTSTVNAGQTFAVYGDVNVKADTPEQLGERLAEKTVGASRGEQAKEGARLVSRGRGLQ